MAGFRLEKWDLFVSKNLSNLGTRCQQPAQCMSSGLGGDKGRGHGSPACFTGKIPNPSSKCLRMTAMTLKVRWPFDAWPCFPNNSLAPKTFFFSSFEIGVSKCSLCWLKTHNEDQPGLEFTQIHLALLELKAHTTTDIVS